MRTWSDVQAFIELNSLPYQVMRWNMSLRGCLIDTRTDQAIARNVRDAVKGLNA